MSETLAYLAGLFDGEGTVTLGKGSNPNAFRRIELTVSSTDECLLDCFVEGLHGGSVYKKTSRGKANWKPVFEYRWTGRGALEGLILLRPYIRCPRKQRRIDHLVHNYERLTVANGQYSEAQRAAKLDFEEQFFNL